MSEFISYDDLRKSLPRKRRKSLTPSVYEEISKMFDPNIDINEYLVGHMDILESGRYKLVDYANACKFVAYKNSGMSNFDSYQLVFPERIDKWLMEGKSYEKIHKYIYNYNSSGLVPKITAKALVPTKILNQDKVQKAINVLSELMMDAKSEMVRMKSAEALIRELKIDDDNKLELDITVKKDESLEQLEQSLNKFAELQYDAMKNNNATPKQIAEMNIIDTKVED